MTIKTFETCKVSLGRLRRGKTFPVEKTNSHEGGFSVTASTTPTVVTSVPSFFPSKIFFLPPK